LSTTESPTSSRESLCPLRNIWLQLQALRTSSSHAPVLIVAFCALELLGMDNAKAALESKAATAVVLIRATTSREWCTSARYPLPAPQTSPNPCPYTISADSTSGVGGKCIPGPALGPKAAVPSVSAEPGVTPPHTPYPLKRPRTKPNPCPYTCSRDSTSGLGGKCIPKPALGPKAAAPSVSAEPAARSRPAPHSISAPTTLNQA